MPHFIPHHLLVFLTLAAPLGSPVAAPARIHGPVLSPLITMASQPTARDPFQLHPVAHRERHILIGGAIGALLGIGVCTAIANLEKDRGQPFQTCPTDTTIYFGLGGFAVGAILGAIDGT